MQWKASIRPATPNPNTALEKSAHEASCHANDTYCCNTFTEAQATQSLQSRVSTTTIANSETPTANTIASYHYSSFTSASELCGASDELNSDVELANLLDISAGTFSGQFANTQDVSLSSRGISATTSIASNLARVTSRSASPASPCTSQQSSDNRSECIYETCQETTASQDASPMQRCFGMLCSMLNAPPFVNCVDILGESPEVENLQHLTVNGLHEVRVLPSDDPRRMTNLLQLLGRIALGAKDALQKMSSRAMDPFLAKKVRDAGAQIDKIAISLWNHHTKCQRSIQKPDPAPNQSDRGAELWACKSYGCGRIYRQKRYLRHHERVHHGVKHWVCNHNGCGVACSDASSLTRHKGSAHREKLWTCSIDGCGRMYLSERSLRKHKKVAHVGGRKPRKRQQRITRLSKETTPED